MNRVLRALLVAAAALLVIAAAGWAGVRWFQSLKASAAGSLPETAVQRGDVTFAVTARGELSGGNTEMLSAPMTGGGAMAITFLRESGELVREGDVVAKFDTTEQEFKLREAQADLAEAEQQVIGAKAESAAKEEEARYALLQARTELAVAELEMQRNELLPRMVARQNELAAAAAQDKLRQLEKDLRDRLKTAQAGIAIQEAARSKATVAAQTAQRNIDAMTLKAKSTGYVARQQNMEGNFRWGSFLPALQVGDNVRAGMGVAQIPDLHNWDVTARIGELDRGHLAVGQPAEIQVVALPGRKLRGAIKNIGGVTGPPWDRRFECKLAVHDPPPELRPGMSTRVVITTDTLRGVNWLPSQALFESDGRKFVYLKQGASFTPKDVKLARRSESRVVIEGLQPGQIVALANPEQMKQKQANKPGGALQALPR
ncbi:MAG TPA: efflux RND transporter periplasmic adaptor subunit [Bryobacteraceae bacterium]|nr:efflux RND transporter periplasmic adaptor subunit [Bryobacteraceae bacterium]